MWKVICFFNKFCSIACPHNVSAPKNHFIFQTVCWSVSFCPYQCEQRSKWLQTEEGSQNLCQPVLWSQFPILTIIFGNFDKYILQYWQIYSAILTNISINSDKYKKQFGQIYFVSRRVQKKNYRKIYVIFVYIFLWYLCFRLYLYLPTDQRHSRVICYANRGTITKPPPGRFMVFTVAYWESWTYIRTCYSSLWLVIKRKNIIGITLMFFWYLIRVAKFQGYIYVKSFFGPCQILPDTLLLKCWVTNGSTNFGPKL